jgi:nitroreductase
MTDDSEEATFVARAAPDPLAQLRNRRSMTKATSDSVPRDLVEAVIEAGTWGPNHRRTEPWRFVVVTGDARCALGDAMASALARIVAETGDAPAGEQLDKERNKPLRAPVVVAVAALPSTDPKTVEIEEIAATAAGIQNMLLAAQALGLGAMWRTGDTAYAPEVKAFLGFPEDAHMLAFIYLGHPEIVPPLRRDGDAREKTRWMGFG